MALTHCLPRYVPIVSFITAIIMLSVFVYFTFATKLISDRLGFWSLVVGALLALMILILIVMLCMYSNELKFQGYMLEYSVKFLNQNAESFAFIPVFILLHLVLVMLILWQHSSFSSHYFSSGNFWKFSSG
jgi:hypothetical protein